MNLITDQLQSDSWGWEKVDDSNYIGTSKVLEKASISLRTMKYDYWEYIIRGDSNYSGMSEVPLDITSPQLLDFIEQMLLKADSVVNKVILEYLNKEIPGSWKLYDFYSWGIDHQLYIDVSDKWYLSKPNPCLRKELSLNHKVGSSQFKRFLESGKGAS